MNQILANAIAPFELTAEPRDTVAYMGSLVTFLATSEDTDGHFGLVELVTKPGNEPPLHIHEREDELFYVLEGEVDFLTEARTISAVPGSSVFLPRRSAHTFRVKSPQARLLVLLTPGGFEGYFRELGTPAESSEASVQLTYAESDLQRFAQTAGRYGVSFVSFGNIANQAAA